MSGGGDDSGSAQGSLCSVDPAASLCDQCVTANCCPSLSACFSNAACQNVANCETAAGCAESPGCVSRCEATYPAGASAYDVFLSCARQRCAICGEEGIGDPCSAQVGNACQAGLACTGAWCTKSCLHASDCNGIGPAGDNVLGNPNACIAMSGGSGCVPGCRTNADCAPFPGTYCVAVTSVEGSSVEVCAVLPDAGP